MRILVLGGTWFLGRAVVVEALARGHEVTTFNRGKTGADVAGSRPVRGDRTRREDLQEVAAAGPYDVVIDTSGYVPADVGLAAGVLSRAGDQYVFVSTVDAYEDWPAGPVTEESALHDCPVDAAWNELPYGHLKAGCERVLGTAWAGPLTTVRPGVVLGPREAKGRLPWWLRRIERGGQVLAPGDPRRAIQPVDVRDAASFIVEVSELRPGSVDAVNLAAPAGELSMGELLEACVRAVRPTGAGVALEWIPDDVVAATGVGEWTELPLWRLAPGTWAMSTDRARRLGLRCCPIEQTVADTWEWLRGGGAVAEHGRTAEHGIAPDREEQVLTAWGRAAPGGSSRLR